MNRIARTVSALILSTGLAMSASSFAVTRADCERDFQPQTGQPGKDVIWVPTNDALVTRMLRMANVTKDDKVYDLGAGDGKIAIAAAKEFGATAVGIEYNPDMAKLGQCYAEAAGVADKVKIIQGDIFETDFSDATVITLYLLPSLNLKLRPTILKMKPGTRVVSHSFLMDDWEPDERSQTQDGSAYFWVVPADVKGSWTFRTQDGNDRFTVNLEQKFQEISGTVGDEKAALNDAKLRGDRIELAFQQKGEAVRLTGRVDGDRIEAKVTRGNDTATYIGTRS
jgi:SAM-dependent methyltransferase